MSVTAFGYFERISAEVASSAYTDTSGEKESALPKFHPYSLLASMPELVLLE